ncbi:glycosyltransferase [Candidatus Woesearchaeota archaeon]|nr:glycosyltransferase [Candidatus Woesearchaeota archaeon]
MKIALFSEAYLPQINGVTKQVNNLRIGLEKQGHEVHVFCPKYPKYKDEQKNVHRYPVFLSLRFLEKIFKVQLDANIVLPVYYNRYSDILSKMDIIHTHHMFVMGKLATHASKKYNIPLTFTNHTNFKEFEKVFPLGESVFKRFIGNYLKKFTKKCDAVISPGEMMKSLLIDYGVSTKIITIPNGIEIVDVKKKDSSLFNKFKQEYKLTGKDKLLLYVGRLSKEKNLVFLIECLENLLKERKDIYLMIVGDGVIKNQLMNLVKNKGISEKVIFTGFVHPEKVLEFYAKSYMFVTTSLSEVFPLTLIESLIAGSPIVAINATGTGDIVENKINGFLAKNDKDDFASKVAYLVKNPNIRAKMSEKAISSVKKFSIENSVNNHLKLYSSLITK